MAYIIDYILFLPYQKPIIYSICLFIFVIQYRYTRIKLNWNQELRMDGLRNIIVVFIYCARFERSQIERKKRETSKTNQWKQYYFLLINRNSLKIVFIVYVLNKLLVTYLVSFLSFVRFLSFSLLIFIKCAIFRHNMRGRYADIDPSVVIDSILMSFKFQFFFILCLGYLNKILTIN